MSSYLPVKDLAHSNGEIMELLVARLYYSRKRIRAETLQTHKVFRCDGGYRNSLGTLILTTPSIIVLILLQIARGGLERMHWAVVCEELARGHILA